eukprot:15346073-Ditylum_brightwellii.AAC.1
MVRMLSYAQPWAMQNLDEETMLQPSALNDMAWPKTGPACSARISSSLLTIIHPNVIFSSSMDEPLLAMLIQ